MVRPALLPSFDAEETTATTVWNRGADRGAARSAPLEVDIETLRAQARAQGFEAGRTDGLAAGRTAAAEWNARLQAVVTALEPAVRALSVRGLELAAEVDRQLPALALLLGERIVRQELRSSATAAQTVIRGVSERLAGCGRVVAVRLAPQAVEAFEAWRGSAGAGALPPGLRVEPDPALGPGEWLLETDDGFLDGRVTSQLESAWRTVSELIS